MNWTEQELNYLKANIGKVKNNILVENLPNRSLEQILRKSSKMGFRKTNSYKSWTEDEINYLKIHYTTEKSECVAKFLGRNQKHIIQKAADLGIKKQTTRKADIEILLHDNPITYYWLGFLLADGCFTDRRIQLGVAKIDLDHLKNFALYVNSNNKIQKVSENHFRIKLTNVKVVKALKSKFNISNRKTYEPCNISNISNKDLFFSLIIGFIDGDGSVCCVKNFKSFRISLVGHSSWIDNFVKIQSFLYSEFSPEMKFTVAKIRNTNVRLPQNKEKTNHNLSTFQIGHKSILIKIKEKADLLQLPYLKRKLGKIIYL